MKQDPVVHFEMPAKDRKRVADFYTKAFGWHMQQLGGDMGNYVLAGTTDTDDKGMVKTPGTINGGFFDYKNEPGFQYPSVVISVDNLKESMEKVRTGGGEILGEPMEIPGIGTYIAFHDTEGNRVGMLAPSKP